MQQDQSPFLQNENQRDAPLSKAQSDYTPPSTLKGTLTSWMVWKFIIYGCFTAICASIGIIVIPIVGRKYFDENTDKNQNCDTSSYSRYAFWYSIFQCLSGFTALISQSYIGRLSDAFGRKRFLYFVWFCTVLPFIPLCFTDNIWWYFAFTPISTLSGMINGMPTILQAAISDITAPQFRTTVYSILFGVCGAVMMVSSYGVMIIQNQWDLRAIFYTFIAVKILAFLFLFFFMDETLKKSNRKPLDDDINSFDKNKDYLIQQQIELNTIGIDISNGSIQYDELHQKPNCSKQCKKCWNSKHNPLRPLCYLKSNKLLGWIGIITLLSAFPETAVNDLAMIYISDNLALCDPDRNSKINSYLVISMAAFMVISQLIILPILSTLMSDIKLIGIAVATLFITFILGIILYFVPTIWIALTLYGFHGMAFSIIPILSGALSKRVSPKEQGVAMGVIHAVKGINACIAPFIFAYLYWFVSNKINNAGFLISMPFMLGAFITFMVYPILCCPLKRVFAKYDEYAFRASIVPFDDNPDGHIPPPQQLL